MHPVILAAVLLLGADEGATRVRGSVVDRATSEPIAGVELFVLSPVGPDGNTRVVTTGEDGTFEARLGPGKFIIGVRKTPALYLWPNDYSRHGSPEPGLEELTLDPLRLIRGGTLRGRVVDEHGQPAEGAWVTATWMHREGDVGFEGGRSARSQADGTFVLEPVAIDVPLELRAETRERASVEITKLPAGQHEPVRLAVSPEGVAPVAGRVVDPQLRPIAGASVHIGGGFRFVSNDGRWQVGRAFDNQWRLTTDAEGRFALPHPLPRLSSHWLGVEARGLLPHESRFEPGSRGPGAPLPDVVLQRAFQLAGRVVDADGQPLPRVTVSTDGRAASSMVGAFTGDDGRFAIENAHPGARIVFVQSDGFRLAAYPVSGDPQALDLTLHPADAGTRPAAPPATTLPSREKRAELLKALLLPVYERVRDHPHDGFAREVLERMAAYDRQFALDRVSELRSERSRVALLLALGEIDEALQQAAASTDPYFRAAAHLEAARAARDAATRDGILAEALVRARQVREPVRRVGLLGDIARQLLDSHQPQAAEPLLEEGLALVEEIARIDQGGYTIGYFAETLARVDREQALALVNNLRDERVRAQHTGNIARDLAASDPEQAERVLELIPAGGRDRYAVPVCHRLAPVDLERARKLLAGFQEERERAYARGVMAFAIREQQPEQARELLREAFAELQHQAIRYRRGRQLFRVSAALLRFGERIDPGFGDEVLRQVIAMHIAPQEGYAREQPEPAHAESAKLAVLLTLFGREPELCRAIMEPIFESVERDGYRPSSENTAIPAALILVDPERAIAWHQRFFTDLDNDDLRLSTANAAWRAMAPMLAPDDEDVWRWVRKEVLRDWISLAEDD